MAQNSLLNFAEQWIDHYKNTSAPVSYRAFDFQSIKRSLIEYLRVYHPEYFNNLIETDELLPLIELFAYVGELYSYRADMNTQEHILSNTTRLASAIPLANMISYTTSRRVAATGLVKLTAISTTESITDVNGFNLKGQLIKWNDPIDNNWHMHFTKVLNRILNNQSGVVSDQDKANIGGVLVERYSTNTSDLENGVVPYSIAVNGTQLPMELVSPELVNGTIRELRPSRSRPMAILYMNDGLGTGSANTGYFFLTKQGSLKREPIAISGRTPNYVHELPSFKINETDVFLNAVDATGNVTQEWSMVANVAYNDADSRFVYHTETLEDDGVRLVFGDGTFGDIPTGLFDCWIRTSESISHSIPTSAIQNRRVIFQYYDSLGNVQSATAEFSLTAPISNAAETESLEKIKLAAPGVFHTQDRMVNARDHEELLLQDPSIVKIKAVNRTFAGHSKYAGWHDGSEVYDNVKIFGNDGTMYFDIDRKLTAVDNPLGSINLEALITDHIEPILDYPDVWLFVAQRIAATPTPRKYFVAVEKQQLIVQLDRLTRGATVGLVWNQTTASWNVLFNSATPVDIEIQLNPSIVGWMISTNVSRVVLHSPTTKFWDYRISSAVDYDTLQPTNDKITILGTNANRFRTGILGSDVVYSVVNLYIPFNSLPNQSTIDYSRVEVVGADVDGGQFPEDLFSESVIGRIVEYPVTANSTNVVLTLPEKIVKPTTGVTGNGLANVLGNNTPSVSYQILGTPGSLTDQIQIYSTGLNTRITVQLTDYVYFYKDPLVASSEYVLVDGTDQTKQYYAAGMQGLIRRIGRSGLYFLWQHFTDQFELVDPARTNINDIYVVTKQQYTEMIRWLQNIDGTIPMPTPPSHLELRNAYSAYLTKGMMSDEIVLRPARFKVLFGSKARAELRARIQLVIRGQVASNLTIKQDVIRLIRVYFDITNTEFGETFFFSDLSKFVSANSKYGIGSMLLVPLFPGYEFGDLYQIRCAPDELLIPDINANDIEIVENITSLNIRQ